MFGEGKNLTREGKWKRKKEKSNWSVKEAVNGISFFFGRREYFIRRVQEQDTFGQSRIRRTKNKRQKIFGELKYLVNQDGV